MIRKNGIDLFRFIGAFFIMILHIPLGELNQEISENLRLLARWAVPFYFMTSGFFIGGKIDNESLDFKKIQKNIASLITILIISSLIYLPIDINAGKTSYEIGNILTGSHFHLWFIGSLLFGYVFIWYIYFIKKSTILPYISIVLLLLATLADSYDIFLSVSFDYPFFRFFLSIPFLYLGVCFSKAKFLQNQVNVLIGLFFCGIIIQTIEMYYFDNLATNRYSHQFLLGTIISAISLFAFSSIINLKENKLTKWGKEHSLFIYLYHPITYIFLMALFKRVTPDSINFVLIFFPIIGFVITLLTGILLKKYFGRLYGILNGIVPMKSKNLK